MATSGDTLWNALLDSCPRNQWIDIQLIYSLVESLIDLQPDDYDPSSIGNEDPTWHRNVRNVLQRRKHTDILWGRRAQYYIPEELGDRDALLEGERTLRQVWWDETLAMGGPEKLRPTQIRQIGIYLGAQGIWVDKERTAHLSEDRNGIAIGLLHTGTQYPDELDDDALIYHYPDTDRPTTRDENEISATRNASLNKVPVFVIVRPSPSSSFRNLRLGWVEKWNDSTKEFLVTFGERPDFPQESPSPEIPFVLTQERRTSAVQQTTRPGQARFRFEVLQRYGSCCAVCDIEIPDMLDAIHIRPVNERGSDDPRNGLVLCANHHRAFDIGLFSFSNSSPPQIILAEGFSAERLKLVNNSLERLNKYPHQDAIQWHYEHILIRSSKYG